MSRWDQLVALAERELALVREGRIEELPATQDERDRLAVSLGRAPVSARPQLERLAAIQEQILVELTLARAALGRELGALRRGRDAVRGYRAAARS
jgi:hypothetical protein